MITNTEQNSVLLNIICIIQTILCFFRWPRSVNHMLIFHIPARLISHKCNEMQLYSIQIQHDISRKCHVITPLNVDSDVSNLCWCHYPLNNMQTLLAQKFVQARIFACQEFLIRNPCLTKMVCSGEIPKQSSLPDFYFDHKDYFKSRQKHAFMPEFYSLPEQTEQLP